MLVLSATSVTRCCLHKRIWSSTCVTTERRAESPVGKMSTWSKARLLYPTMESKTIVIHGLDVHNFSSALKAMASIGILVAPPGQSPPTPTSGSSLATVRLRHLSLPAPLGSFTLRVPARETGVEVTLSPLLHPLPSPHPPSVHSTSLLWNTHLKPPRSVYLCSVRIPSF